VSKLATVEVIFKDKKYNYKTSVNGDCTDESLRDYFIDTCFDLATYSEPYIMNVQRCIDIKITR